MSPALSEPFPCGGSQAPRPVPGAERRDAERRREAIAERVMALSYLLALGAWLAASALLGAP